MEEYYMLAKSMVISKYGEEYPFYPLLVLSLSTLLYKYKDHKEIVMDVFQKTSFFIEEGSIPKIMKKHHLDFVNFFEEEEALNDSLQYTFGVSSNGDSFYINEAGDVDNDKTNPYLVCTTNCNPVFLLNITIHELNHLVKGCIDSSEVIKENDSIGYIIRSGINYYHYKYVISSDTLYETDYFSTLDEVINTLQTTEMMQNILMLDGLIPDLDIQDYLSGMDKDLIKQDFGYEAVVKLFKPLWENPIFCSLIENHILRDQLEIIVEMFDDVLYKGAFCELSDCLDEIDEAECGIRKRTKKAKKRVQEIVQQYNKNTNYTYHK